MKLVTINNTTSGTPGAMLKSGEILHLAKAAKAGTLETWIPGSVRDILEAGPDAMAVVKQLVKRAESASTGELAQLRETGALTSAETHLLTPVPNPRLVVAAGLAFKSHLAEMAGTPTPAHPTGFLKSVNSIVGSDVPVTIPNDTPNCIDYEGELAVVFGMRCHCVSAADAMRHVAGYMVANDISARDWVRDVFEAKEAWPARLTWEINIMGKQFDTFTPLGPVLVTVDDISDVTALEIITRLNGKEMQKAPMSDLIFTLAETIAYFSKWYTFQPGDILLTGTPAGVGVGRKPPVFMKVGDVIEIEVCGIGTLRNILKAAI